jgi:large subunit ribosomal protein L21
MYAVIRAGGKQFRVAPGDVIRVENTPHDENGRVSFDVLMVSAEAGKIEKPNGGAAIVTGQVLEEGRAKKVLVFHFKRKKQYKKLQGHRQGFTAVRISEISFGGKKETAPELPKKQKKATPAAEAAAAPETKSAAPSKAAAKKSAAKKAPAKKAPAKKSTKGKK